MIYFALIAVTAGLLVGLSRQLNGRLAMSTNAMESSFWNHIVGLGFISLLALGIGGLFDPAKSIAGVERSVEDFGQTLGRYRVGHGFYLVLPIVGPSSLRDATGFFVDSFADPLRYANLESVESLGVKFLDAENRLSLDKETYEGIVHDSIDPYLFIRAAYAQRRLAQVGEDTYNINIFEGPMFDSDLLNPFDWFGF